MYQQYLNYPKHLLGWFTRIFNNEEYKKAIIFSKSGTEVDYVGTGGMVVSKELFINNSELYNIPEECSKTEDIYLSYIARKSDYKLMAVEKHLDMLKDNKNQCARL